MSIEVEHSPKITTQEKSELNKKLEAIDLPFPKGEKVLPNGRREWIQEIRSSENSYDDTVIIVIAHPDDEAFVGGTIAKLAEKGKRVIVISLTDGAAGTKEHTYEEIVQIRRNEEADALDILGAHIYINLGFKDGKLSSHETEAIETLTQFYRLFDPKVVIAHREQDYHHDHKVASHISETALFNARININVQEKNPVTKESPAFYVMDPQGLKTETGEDTKDITMVVNISNRLEKKLNSFAAHKSQLKNLNPDQKDYLDKSRKEAKRRGKLGHFSYGEALKQITYGGEKFIEENILGEWLGKKEYVDKRKKRKLLPI